MNIPDSEILNECRKLIIAFKNHLSIINGEFLSHHIIGIIRRGEVCYRDSDRNWYYKDYCAELDSEAQSIIGIDKHGVYYVTSTFFPDNYLYDLINSLRIKTEERNYSDFDEIKINELEKRWREEIVSKYQRDEHLRRFVWDLKPFIPASKCSHLRNDTLKEVNNIIPNKIDFYSFISCGLCCQYISPNQNNRVRIVKSVGLFGAYVRYGYDKVILQDQNYIEIPSNLFAPGLRSCCVSEISKGVFESLHEAEIIKLPSTIEKIDWSFWHCKKLKSIEVDKDNKSYCSIDGVLYSRDHKVLYAYPNKHGNIYEIPEGVEIIEKFAFKDCDIIEMLMFPSTIKLIKINAFYRAINLKRVVCACKKGDFVDEGFYGDYGDVAPQWYYIQ